MLRAAFIILSVSLITGPAAAQDTVQSHIQRLVESMAATKAFQVRNQQILSHDVLQKFYANRDFQPAWHDTERIDELLGLVSSALEHGLQPEDYLAGTLQRELALQASNPTPTHQAELDILLSESLVRYGINRRFGKVSPEGFDPNINFDQRFRTDEALEVTLEKVIERGNFREQLQEATQSGPWYAALKEKLAELQGQFVGSQDNRNDMSLG